MQGYAWRRREGSVAQKTLDPHHSPATGRFRFQYLLFLSALMVLAGLMLSSSGAAPAAYQYYILNPRIQNAPLLVMSLADGNRIRVDAAEFSLDRHQRTAITAGTDLAPGTRITGSGPFTLASEAGGTDMPVPGLFAGTEFVIPHHRDHHQYYLLSPRGDARVEILQPAGPQYLDLPEGEVVVYDAGSDNFRAGLLRSDRPILVEHNALSDSGSPRDVYPVPPAARELLGIRSRTAVVAALEDDTLIQVYASDGNSIEYHLNAGQMQNVTVGTGGSQGTGTALRIVADKPVAAIQVDDRDGAEATAFLGTPYLGTHHGIPVDTQYLALACPERYTRITLHQINGGSETRYCAASGYDLTPGVAYFGSAANGAHIPAGSYLESDQPVYLYHEAQLSEGERNLLGEGFDYFLLDDRSQQAPLAVFSLVDDNRVQAGDYSQWMSRHWREEIPAGSNLSPGTRITSSGPLFLGSPLPGTDQPVPGVFAGMEFVIPHYRNRHVYGLLSPYGDARAEIRIAGILETIELPQGQLVEYEAGEVNGLAGIVQASRPILLQHTGFDGDDPVDVYPVPPADDALWGIRSHFTLVGALHDATTVEIHASNGDTESHTLNAGETRQITIGYDASQGTGNALHIRADKPVAAVQLDDGDGLEAVAFMGESYLGTRYVVPVDTQYIAVACPEPDTRIKLAFMDGMSPTFLSRTCSGDAPAPGKTYLGSNSEGVHIPAGAYLESDKPIHLVHEAAATQGERNLLGYSGTPNMHIASPEDGEFTNQTRPVIRVELSGHDIDFSTNTLQLYANEQRLDANCHYETDFSECIPDNPLATGYVRLKTVLHAPTGQPLEVDQVQINVDTAPPLMWLYSPEDGDWVNTADLLVRGQMSEPGTAQVNGTEVALYGKYNFQHTLVLQEGANDIQVEVKDRAGNENRMDLVVYLDSIAPEIIDSALVEVTEPAEGMTTISGEAGSAEPEGSIHLLNLDNSETTSTTVDAEGRFSVSILANPGDRIAITVLDRAGNSSETREFQVPGGAQDHLPPDPSTVAPPLDPTVATTLYAATGFLYTGPNPIQQGVAPGTIEARRVAVLRGRVQTRGGQALSGVTIRIKGHDEFGHTLSRADGMFDLAVNGGGWLTVRYEREGYLPVQRQIKTPWQEYAWLPDVVMIGLDPQVTSVDLTAATPIQTARGASVTDSDGTRQATVLFPQGTQAEMVLPDGTVQPLGTLNVRATEYTVGEDGPATMPGELPPTSGYTYAVELSVDEAIAAGAREVRFDRPLPFYLENFLDFPVGGIVPAGWYDRERSAWIPSDNGRIVQILSISEGMAVLDVDGSGNPADTAALEELGISEAERRELALLYTPGQSLWRVPVEHFTPWDCNWPFGPPEGAEPPNTPEPSSDDQEEEPECESGSIIECQNQVLRNTVEISGTPYSLNYRSDRVPGREASFTLRIPLSGESIPPGLKRIDLEVEVSGQYFRKSFPSSGNQTYIFTWDGKDAFNRYVNGAQNATVRIGYVYTAEYYSPSNFAKSFSNSGVGVISSNKQRHEITYSRRYITQIGVMNAKGIGIGTWSISSNHIFHQVSSNDFLYKGDGVTKRVGSLGKIITTVAGTGVFGNTIDGIPAIDARIGITGGVAMGSDGSIYITQTSLHNIRRIDPEGTISTVAGTGSYGYSGDGGPASEARLNGPSGIAISDDGSLYFADRDNYVIRKISPEGIISTVVGTGSFGYGGDGGPATESTIGRVSDISIGQDSSLYFSDDYWDVIRKITPDGIISTVAGTGAGGYSGDGGLAVEAQIDNPQGVSVSDDGVIYVADAGNYRVRRIDASGTISTVAGNGSWAFDGDGLLATEAGIPGAADVLIGNDGDLYISDASAGVVRKVGLDGIIRTIAGTGVKSYSGDGGPAKKASLRTPGDMTMGIDGSLYIADTGNYTIRKIGIPFTGMYDNEYLVSSDMDEYYAFDENGRHLRTHSKDSGASRYKFSYNQDGYLSAIEDESGNITLIERANDSGALAIISPDGIRTELTLDDNGYLASITNPAGEAYHMTYSENGLLKEFSDPRENISRYYYDALGRLNRTENSAGGGWTLDRTDLSNGYEISMASAEGRMTRYRVDSLSTGDKLRTNTHPDGTLESTLYKLDGLTIETDPDGTVTELLQGPDPRFGMDSPVPERKTITTPSGLTRQVTTERTATLQDKTDLLSHTELSEIITHNNRVSTSRYTAANRTWLHTSPAGRELITILDEKGRATQQAQAGLAPMTYAYDAHGRLEEMLQASGAQEERRFTLAYDDDGWLASITDPLSRTLSFDYDEAGRVTRQVLPDGREVSFQYDPNGNLTALIPPGRDAHLFSYTSVNLESQYTPPDLTGMETVTQYSYNLDKQLTRIDRPDGRSLQLDYDPGGRLQWMTMARGQYRYDYYPDTGRLSRITVPDGGTLDYNWDGFLPLGETWSGDISGSISFSYDNNFWLTGLAVSGDSVAFGYDDDGLLTSAGILAITRDPQHGLPTGTQLGSLATSSSYNGFGELIQKTAAMGEDSMMDITYTRDALGRIETISEMVDGISATHEYIYDQAGRLVTATRDGVTTTWTYDNNGNRTHVNGAPVATYDEQDRMLTYGSASYNYTKNGELEQKTEAGVTTSYDYDELGNLVKATLPGDMVIEYLIDGHNRRIGKKINGTLVQGFLYQDQLNPVVELDGNGNVMTRFVYAEKPNVPAYMVKGGITYRILSDHLGSPRLIVNTDTGEIAQRMNYDVWGNILFDTNPGFQPFGFAGGIHDHHIGLVRFGARDYDPVTGRWTSKDPIRFKGNSLNLYAYTSKDPVNFIDPDGRLPWLAPAILVGYSAGAILLFKDCMEKLTNTDLGGDTCSTSGENDNNQGIPWSQAAKLCANYALLMGYGADPLGSTASTIGQELTK